MIEYNVSKFLKFIYNKNIKLFFIMRKICMYILNLYVAIYYNLLNKLKKQKLKRNDKKPGIIVSLTSYGQRIKKVWIPIEMMFNQTVKPNRIILWLDKNEFSDNSAYSKKIKRLIKRGLEIKYCDNIVGHKKYYYSMKENTEDILIMIDDDIIYHNKIIEELLNTYEKYRNCIVCQRAHLITYKNNHIAKYKEWKKDSNGIIGPSYLLCQTNGAGTLIPPHLLSSEVFNLSNIKNKCLYADDIWIKVISAYSKVKVVKVDKISLPIIGILGTQKKTLSKINVDCDKNDEQIEELLKLYKIDFQKMESN